MKFITDDDGEELFNNLEKQANESEKLTFELQ
jgi:hypothetical protein